jgi:DNA-binding response OmpR family regulator
MTGAIASRAAPDRPLIMDGMVRSELPRLLIVEADPTFRDLVVEYREREFIQVVEASGPKEASRSLNVYEPALIILIYGGLDRFVRSGHVPNVPVIITVGDQCDEIDRVLGLELGSRRLYHEALRC